MPNLGRHRSGQREVRRAKPEVPGERLEERRRHAGRDDDTSRVNRAAGGEDIHVPAPEGDAPDRRALEEPGPTIAGRRRQTEARAVRVEGGACLVADGGAGIEPELAPNRAGVEYRRVETDLSTHLQIVLEPRHLFGAERDGRGACRVKGALDVNAAQQRAEIERGAPPRPKHLTCDPAAENLLDIHEPDARIAGNPAGCRSRA